MIGKIKGFLLVLIVGLAGSFFLAPHSAAAENRERVVYVNPVYKGVITEKEISKGGIRKRAALSEIPYFASMEEAGAYLRQGMKERDGEIVFKINLEDFKTGTHQISDYALEVTRETPGDEGDYLRYHFGGWEVNGSYVSGSTLYTVTYTMKYYTTIEEEREVDRQVNAVLNSLSLSGRSDYEKILAIYRYVCENVDYDYGTYTQGDFGKYTAYNALVKKKAVCQGYASLLYRLLRESGVTSRVIAGIGMKERHAWNIAPIGNLYYNLDSTWDANYQWGNYQYFLESQGDFQGHTRDEEFAAAEFLAEYPMSESSYHNWIQKQSQYKEPSCQEAGWREVSCSDCGKEERQELEALGHEFGQWETTKESACTEPGEEQRECIRGDKTETQEKEALGHQFGQWETTKESTCTEPGEEQRTCIRGDKTETRTTAALGHIPGEWKVTKEAGCTEGGERVKACSRCGEVLEREETEKKGHRFLEWKTIRKATVLKEGKEERSCADCGCREQKNTAKKKATLTLTAGNITMQAGRTTTALKVKKCGEGDKAVSWTSSKPKVVSVNKRTGKLTAKKTGYSYITVKMKSGIQKRIRVKVQKGAVKARKLSLNKKRVTLKKGKKFRLSVTKTPITATDRISYRSSNSKVAKVSQKGVITGKKKGKAVITVKASGGKKTTCRVVVK